jgi:hypothetical protein
MVEALAEVRRIQEKAQAVAGVHVVQPVPADALAKMRDGYRFIAFGIDYLFLLNHARSGLQEIRRAR